MPTIFSHALIGLAGGAAVSSRGDIAKVVSLSMACALLPDADVVGFKLGIRYEDFLGHRGFFHSLFFAALVGLLVATLFFRQHPAFSKGWCFYAAYFSAITASHGLLDAMTNGGLGIALLSPFDNSRYFFDFRPIAVSPISPARFFTQDGLRVVLNELLWVWCPVVTLYLLVRWRHRRFAAETVVSRVD